MTSLESTSFKILLKKEEYASNCNELNFNKNSKKDFQYIVSSYGIRNFDISFGAGWEV